MEVLNTGTFKEKIFDFENNSEWKFAGSAPTIVDFYADWCGPCRMLSPILEELSQEYKGRLNIYKVDTEASPELAALFGVRSIPSLLFIPQTGEPSMAAGLVPKDKLKQVIQDVLKV